MKRAATVGVLIALTTLSAAAQQPFEYKVNVMGEAVKGSAGDHFLTFSGPFQIPEVTLPAGTYVFTVVAPSVVRVSSPDRSQQYATVLHRADCAAGARRSIRDGVRPDRRGRPGAHREVVPAEPERRLRIPVSEGRSGGRALADLDW